MFNVYMMLLLRVDLINTSSILGKKSKTQHKEQPHNVQLKSFKAYHYPRKDVKLHSGKSVNTKQKACAKSSCNKRHKKEDGMLIRSE